MVDPTSQDEVCETGDAQMKLSFCVSDPLIRFEKVGMNRDSVIILIVGIR
jgi:hypothetical protein